jgi:DNA mismatch repair protein MutS
MENEIIFLHRIVSGGTDKSFGIQVAGLAGVPKAVIDRAKALLETMQQNNAQKGNNGDKTGKAEAAHNGNGADAEPLLCELANLDIGRVSPLEALNLLNRFKNRAEKLI